MVYPGWVVYSRMYYLGSVPTPGTPAPAPGPPSEHQLLLLDHLRDTLNSSSWDTSGDTINSSSWGIFWDTLFSSWDTPLGHLIIPWDTRFTVGQCPEADQDRARTDGLGLVAGQNQQK